MTNFLVTGATGNVGSQVVRELQERGQSVRTFVRNPDKAASMFGQDVQLAVGDFSDRESILAALDGVERVFLACSNHPSQVDYETNVIDAAKAVGVRRIVKLSAVGAEIGSPLAFWDWHGQIEQHLHASGLPAVILRSHFYMSNLLASAETIRHAGKLFVPAGGARIPMTDPRDVATVAAVALTQDGHEGKTYLLTGPEAITYDDIARKLSEITGRTIEFVNVPDEAMRQGMTEAGMPGWLTDNLIILFGILRRNTTAQTTDTVRAVTGREPHSFSEFARDHLLTTDN